MGSGFNFFTNALNRSPGSTGGWVDVDVSADIPSGSTGVLLDITNTDASTIYKGNVRKNGSSDNRTPKMTALTHLGAAIGVDANRVYEGYIESTSVRIWLMGYTGDGTDFILNGVNKSLSSTGSWIDVDCSADIPSGATGVVIEIYNTASIGYQGAVRKNGSSDNQTAYSDIPPSAAGSGGHIYAFIGVDTNRIFEGYIENTSIDFYLLGYTLSPVTFFTNMIDKSLTGTGSWTDIDVTAETSTTADGIMVHIYNLSTWKKGIIRKNGSGDDRSATAKIQSTGHIWGVCGMDADQIFEGYIDNTNVDFYLQGYAQPSGPTLKEVTDSFGLSDSVLRDKAFTVSDSFGLTDTSLTHKILLISDSQGLSEEIFLSKLKEVLDSFGLSDTVLRDKTVTVSDMSGMSDTVAANKELILSDSINQTDAVLVNKLVLALDSFGLLDIPLKDWTPQVTDSIGLTDSILRDKTLTVSDSQGSTDQVTLDKVIQVLDSMGLTDSVEKLVALAKIILKLFNYLLTAKLPVYSLTVKLPAYSLTTKLPSYSLAVKLHKRELEVKM